MRLIARMTRGQWHPFYRCFTTYRVINSIGLKQFPSLCHGFEPLAVIFVWSGFSGFAHPHNQKWVAIPWVWGRKTHGKNSGERSKITFPYGTKQLTAHEFQEETAEIMRTVSEWKQAWKKQLERRPSILCAVIWLLLLPPKKHLKNVQHGLVSWTRLYDVGRRYHSLSYVVKEFCVCIWWQHW